MLLKYSRENIQWKARHCMILGKKFTSILHVPFFLCINQETNVFPILSELFQKTTNFQSLPMVFVNIKTLCLFSSLWSSLQCSHFPLVSNDHKSTAAPGSGWASKCSATILLIRKSRRLRKLTSPKSQIINCGFKNRINFIVTSKKNEIPRNRPTKGGGRPILWKLLDIDKGN